MTTNSTEYLTSIGLDSVYIAQVLQDDADAYLADTPIYLAPAAELTGAPKINEEILYYDDQAYESLLAEGPTERKLKISALPNEIEALITGEVFNSATGRQFDSADPANASYFALGYRSKKSNGHYRYTWYLKGLFQKPANDHASSAESPQPKPVELTYNAIKTIHKFDQGTRTDGAKRVKGDEDTANFSATTWFSAVQTPVASAPSALTCTPSPADGATGVLITANVVLTFNNAIRSGNTGVVITENDGTIVAGAYSWDAAYKVLTFNPTSDLSAGTDYLVTLSGVTDIYGQTLANTVYNFTTAA